MASQSLRVGRDGNDCLGVRFTKDLLGVLLEQAEQQDGNLLAAKVLADERDTFRSAEDALHGADPALLVGASLRRRGYVLCRGAGGCGTPCHVAVRSWSAAQACRGDAGHPGRGVVCPALWTGWTRSCSSSARATWCAGPTPSGWAGVGPRC